jgi:hypothetical protein
VAHLQVTTRWSDATLSGRFPADPLPSDPSWAGGSLLTDEQAAHADASPEAVFATVAGIGGDRGWYVTPLLWALRGWADKLVGGVGMRRGRRHPDELGVGDALDFWRVEAVEPPTLIRLRAEMRLPGEAWLEWRIEPDGPHPATGPTGPGGGHRAGATLHQRAIFYPRGLWGRAYWYALVPFHGLIFARLCARLAEAAQASPKVVGTSPSS